jgi:secreted protein with Ig-like and vWFA domain
MLRNFHICLRLLAKFHAILLIKQGLTELLKSRLYFSTSFIFVRGRMDSSQDSSFSNLPSEEALEPQNYA